MTALASDWLQHHVTDVDDVMGLGNTVVAGENHFCLFQDSGGQ